MLLNISIIILKKNELLHICNVINSVLFPNVSHKFHFSFRPFVNLGADADVNLPRRKIRPFRYFCQSRESIPCSTLDGIVKCSPIGSIVNLSRQAVPVDILWWPVEIWCGQDRRRNASRDSKYSIRGDKLFLYLGAYIPPGAFMRGLLLRGNA